ncbi:ABC transporter permease [Streptantibioticus cattleyicolor]|uniref:Transport permease protein n=1 Tax=Streptantibioticus cattleyicolor (strain ATCC 35852 / DSM 46488 / JCM 4925 / NBRC 14057 / NRRL 8057) TaxID=1003195 RepID=F8JIZ1_STREN|nr:ABC transporter permease [Streptantibioticus cattleyicolor]AEW98923.1 ABC-2 type transporter [Streptantibioticus cattleyicolor NRRL 8057 = DSM 46488]CCB72031.1 ABC-2 type transporter [Streptantibioticus cattleyicolor NRRL 8057 = DSM 46488]
MSAAPRRGAALLWHQIRYEQLTFWRNPQSAFFTFVFPVVVMAVFGALFGGVGATGFYYGRSALQYYTATIAAVSVLGSCYSQLAIVLSARRQHGVLKRVRATPLPAAVYVAGLLAHCVLVSVVDVLLIAGVGRLYGVPLPAISRWPALVVVLVLGAGAFCALGVAVASLIRDAEAAPPVVQLVSFPLTFVSGTYLPIHSAALNAVAGALPVKPFNDALLTALASGGSGVPWRSCGVLLLWATAASAVAVRRFRWDPRPE